SLFHDWLNDGRVGLHHVGILVGDFAVAERVCADAGASVLLEGTMSGGRGRFFYARMTESAPFLEVIEPAGKLLIGFEYMREAARHWDGHDPVRRAARR
ncbi:MAG: VOC family protein, partial [Rhodospirillaceae bacterium]|nr:VOC family protein [Rhodospirillaceae bacterium]